MSPVSGALSLLTAGIVGGAATSAGAIATLISYPMLLAVGIPPVTANITNAVAVAGTGITSGLASGPELAGTAARLRRAARTHRRERAGREWLSWGLFGVGVYNGYFGAASGIMLLALLMLTAEPRLVRANALKNVLLGIGDVVAAGVFIGFGACSSWRPGKAGPASPGRSDQPHADAAVTGGRRTPLTSAAGEARNDSDLTRRHAAERRRRSIPRGDGQLDEADRGGSDAAMVGGTDTSIPLRRRPMARPERPLDPSVGPIAAFATELRKLRAEAGSPKYLQMARRTGRSRTALAEAAGGDHLPTWETVEAFVTACGADPSTWYQAWEEAKEAARSGAPASLLPAAEPDHIPVAVPGDESDHEARPERKPRSPQVMKVLGAVALVTTGLVVGALGAVGLTGSVGGQDAGLRPPSRRVLPAGGDGPVALAFTPFAAFVAGELATSGPGGIVNVWDRGGARLLRRINTGASPVTALAFDPLDADILVTAGPSGIVRVWDTSSGKPLFSERFASPRGSVLLSFNRSIPGLLAVAEADGDVLIWDSQNHRRITEIRTGLSRITALSFDRNSQVNLAVGGTSGAAIWNALSGTLVQDLHGVSGPVSAMGFDPFTPNTLAIATVGGGLGIWDSSNGRPVRTMRDSVGVTALAFNPQIRNSLASGDGHGRIDIWDASNGLLIHRVGAHSAKISSLCYAQDGQSLASGDAEGKTTVWRVHNW